MTEWKALAAVGLGIALGAVIGYLAPLWLEIVVVAVLVAAAFHRRHGSIFIPVIGLLLIGMATAHVLK
jgi:hypothetical protein